ncbi:hypothetical protein ACWGBU_40095, partial [Streptomyces vinaceus]
GSRGCGAATGSALARELAGPSGPLHVAWSYDDEADPCERTEGGALLPPEDASAAEEARGGPAAPARHQAGGLVG